MVTTNRSGRHPTPPVAQTSVSARVSLFSLSREPRSASLSLSLSLSLSRSFGRERPDSCCALSCLRKQLSFASRGDQPSADSPAAAPAPKTLRPAISARLRRCTIKLAFERVVVDWSRTSSRSSALEGYRSSDSGFGKRTVAIRVLDSGNANNCAPFSRGRVAGDAHEGGFRATHEGGLRATLWQRQLEKRCGPARETASFAEAECFSKATRRERERERDARCHVQIKTAPRGQKLRKTSFLSPSRARSDGEPSSPPSPPHLARAQRQYLGASRCMLRVFDWCWASDSAQTSRAL